MGGFFSTVFAWVQAHVVASVVIGATAVAAVGGGTTAIVISAESANTQPANSVANSNTPSPTKPSNSQPPSATPSASDAPLPSSTPPPAPSSKPKNSNSNSSSAGGQSEQSQPATSPAASNVRITPNSMNAFTVSWNAATAPSNWGSQYLVIISGCADWSCGESWQTSATSWASPSDYWDSPGAVVHVKVCRKDAAASWTANGDCSSPASVTMPNGIPDAPTNIQYSVDGSLNLTVSWNAPNANGGTIDDYQVLTGDPTFSHGDGFDSTSSPATGDVSYSATSDVHCFKVRAHTAAGQWGAYSQSYCW